MKDENKVKAGKAAADSMTPEQRKERARNAALSRWSTEVPVAEHEGSFPLGDKQIDAAVLPNGKRLITQAAFLTALGRSRSPKAGTGILSTVDGIPFFLQADALKPFIDEDLIMSTTPIFYKTKSGSRGVGYDAELLPRVADVYLKLRDKYAKSEKKLPQQYRHIIEACDLLMRGLAHVGIIALVDEATGYQYDRARNALAEYLEKWIAKELVKWAKTFQNEFYEEICRLKGVTLADINKRPSYFGKITNDLVYERLAPNILTELKKETPKDEKGRHKTQLHRRLTPEFGHPRLKEHLASEVTLMRVFDDGDWDGFYKALNKTLPKQKNLPLFDPPPDAE